MRRPPVPDWLARVGIFSWLALGVLGFSAVIVLGLSTFSAIMLPIIFSAVAAAVFAPLVDQLERWGIPRGLGSLLTIALIIGGLVGIVAMITRSVINQSDQLAAAFTLAFEDLRAWLADLGIDESLIDQARQAVTTLLNTGGSGLVSSAAGVASSAASLVMGMFFGLVFLFFLMRDAPVTTDLGSRATSTKPGRRSGRGDALGRHVIRRYFTGRAVVAHLRLRRHLGRGALVLGIPLVPAIAVLTLIGGFVPYLGAIVAARWPSSSVWPVAAARPR
jgi:putative heme transporter